MRIGCVVQIQYAWYRFSSAGAVMLRYACSAATHYQI